MDADCDLISYGLKAHRCCKVGLYSAPLSCLANSMLLLIKSVRRTDESFSITAAVDKVHACVELPYLNPSNGRLY